MGSKLHTTEEFALAMSEDKGVENDIDKRLLTNKWVSIVLIFSTLAFPGLLCNSTLFFRCELSTMQNRDQHDPGKGQQWAAIGRKQKRGGQGGYERI